MSAINQKKISKPLEQDTMAYVLHRSKENIGQFLFYEKYRDQQALDYHGSTPYLKDLFENYAIIWREISTKELKEYLLNNDPHAPKKVRVNGVLSQFEEFQKTYNIKQGDKMYVSPEDRVWIW